MESHLKNPHQSALITLAGFVGLAVLVMLVTWGLSLIGYVASAVLWIGFVFIAFFSLLFLIIWILGVRQMRRAKAFLESERVLVRWTYTLAEWQQLKEPLWQEEKDDWKVQFGCLTFLLALTGLLTGIMLGWEDGVLAVVTHGLGGLILGGLIGAVCGTLVAGSNYWSTRQMYKNPEPGLVALGIHEVYASNDYFKGDGVNSFIREVKFYPGSPARLELQLVVPPRPRMPAEEQWIIPVPSRWATQVDEILPLLASQHGDLKVE